LSFRPSILKFCQEFLQVTEWTQIKGTQDEGS